MNIRTPSIGRRQYRWLDVGTKLGGIALIAVGLETGIVSAPGLVFALAGVLLGVSTVFITHS